MSNQNWTPGQPYHITVTEINPYMQQTYSQDLGGGGYDRTGRTRNRPRTGTDLFKFLTKQDIDDINEAIYISNTILAIEAHKPNTLNQFQIRLNQLPTTLQGEITTATNNYGGTHGLSPADALTRQQTAVNHLIHKKTADRNIYQTKANAFYGSDPIVRTQQDFIEAYLRIPSSEALSKWTESFTSAYAAQLATEEVRQLTHRSQALTSQINQARAEEQLVAIQKAEAERAAHERAAAEEKRQFELARQAELNKTQSTATTLADKFDETYVQLAASLPDDDIDKKLRLLKDKLVELTALSQDATNAENAVWTGFGEQRNLSRLSSLMKIKVYIDALTQKKYQIEKVILPAVSGAEASLKPLVTTPDGLIAGYETLPISLGGAIDAARKAGAALGSGQLAVLVGSVFYSPSLGNGELQRSPVVLSIPFSQLSRGLADNINLLDNDSITVPFRAISSVRGEHTQLYLSETGERLSDRVRVRKVKLDPLSNLYTFTTEGLLPRTLTWTPNNAPGSETLGSTALPSEQSDIKIYPGARVTTVEGRIDEHPTCDEADSDDYILWFPKEAGIKPVYVMASRTGPRYEPGTVTGMGKAVGENWLGSASTTDGAPIPSQIADQLRDQDFRDFDKFREKLWSTVTNDPELSRQFSHLNKTIMKDGYSPYAPRKEQVGGREKFEIHHVHPIGTGGEVYNMVIMTPKTHISLHSKDKGEPQ